MIKFDTPRGMITVTTEVFTNISGEAATGCFGVKGMGARSKADGLVHLLRRESMGKGVRVSFNDEEQALISLHIVVDYGVNIMAVCDSIINEVSYKVSKATGVPVAAVDVYIDSVRAD